MSGIKDQEQIDELRARLYDRGKPPLKRAQFHLEDTPEPVQETWQKPPEPKVAQEETPRTYMATARRKKYRIKILIIGILFFIGALAVSSFFLFTGANQISGENISISLSGPFTIGGGETLSLQVGVTNANMVPIQAATLIIEYPEGTKSVDEITRDIFIERVALDVIASGESINVPLKAVVFGEENDEQTIHASVEYRVEGSNATFFKEAEPLRYKISSAPVVARVTANDKISSGQETDIVVTVVSNTQTTLTDVLVEAEYPFGFDFVSSDPTPLQGKGLWLIEELEPGEEQEITITGILVGREDDELAVHFSVGVPTERNKMEMASVFNVVSTEFIIEQPFIDVALDIDSSDGVRVLEPGETMSGKVVVQNTLSDTVYDTQVTVRLSGNALSDPAVSQTDGFYDSADNTITWDAVSQSSLEEMQPGDSVSLSFSFQPNQEITRTPEVTIVADVTSTRVRENNVPQSLGGSATGVVKVETVPVLLSEARRTAGPVPPVAEEVTTYTLSFLAETQSNDLNNVTVTTVLPRYVTWKDQASGAGSITFNSAARTITWDAGNIESGKTAVGSFVIDMRPSVTQVDRIVTLMEDQRLKATDAFTGTEVRVTKEAVTSELSTELGFEKGNGRVVE